MRTKKILALGIIFAFLVFTHYMAFISGQVDIKRNTSVLSGAPFYPGTIYGSCAEFKGLKFCSHDVRDEPPRAPLKEFGAWFSYNSVQNLCVGPYGRVWFARVENGSIKCYAEDMPYY